MMVRHRILFVGLVGILPFIPLAAENTLHHPVVDGEVAEDGGSTPNKGYNSFLHTPSTDISAFDKMGLDSGWVQLGIVNVQSDHGNLLLTPP